jgi:hypothetical protein
MLDLVLLLLEIKKIVSTHSVNALHVLLDVVNAILERMDLI